MNNYQEYFRQLEERAISEFDQTVREGRRRLHENMTKTAREHGFDLVFDKRSKEFQLPTSSRSIHSVGRDTNKEGHVSIPDSTSKSCGNLIGSIVSPFALDKDRNEAFETVKSLKKQYPDLLKDEDLTTAKIKWISKGAAPFALQGNREEAQQVLSMLTELEPDEPKKSKRLITEEIERQEEYWRKMALTALLPETREEAMEVLSFLVKQKELRQKKNEK